ncbi:peptidase associated/transthyretin-like domain-containing protein [Calycomorphotria hydatis]|uniref:Carboxypeptidase regulatory-like domain-containing protein n=1 Tax=Calycomorphotria hydatis TaxID=2528027 RepID=A0A517TF45_9PLAN|nr:carboxypeptidase-like regulatory domain-containing protein [Calycomorphotria hydatis]QDT66993.1 hypothetical protein V22_42650 [Calycomorphotria hydatis]
MSIQCKTVAVCLLAFSLSLTGCNSAPSDLPEIAQVSGTVTLDGEPLPYATLMFQPSSGRPSVGVTDQSGNYSLAYNSDYQGAKVGPHTIKITTFQEFDDPDNPEKPARPELLPAKYHTETELTAEINQGKNTVDFELSSN